MQPALLVGDDDPAPVAQLGDDELGQLPDLLVDVQGPRQHPAGLGEQLQPLVRLGHRGDGGGPLGVGLQPRDAQRDLRGQRLEHLDVVGGERVRRSSRAATNAPRIRPSTRSGRAAIARTSEHLDALPARREAGERPPRGWPAAPARRASRRTGSAGCRRARSRRPRRGSRRAPGPRRRAGGSCAAAAARRRRRRWPARWTPRRAPARRAARSPASSSMRAALASSAATSAIAVARCIADSRCSACRRASVTSRIVPRIRTGSPRGVGDHPAAGDHPAHASRRAAAPRNSDGELAALLRSRARMASCSARVVVGVDVLGDTWSIGLEPGGPSRPKSAAQRSSQSMDPVAQVASPRCRSSWPPAPRPAGRARCRRPTARRRAPARRRRDAASCRSSSASSSVHVARLGVVDRERADDVPGRRDQRRRRGRRCTWPDVTAGRSATRGRPRRVGQARAGRPGGRRSPTARRSAARGRR